MRGRKSHQAVRTTLASGSVYSRLRIDVKQNTRKYMHNTLPTKELRPYQPEEILATSVPCMAVPKTRSACR